VKFTIDRSVAYRTLARHSGIISAHLKPRIDVVVTVFLHILGVSLGVGLGHPFFCLDKLVEREFNGGAYNTKSGGTAAADALGQLGYMMGC
jgi:hypothetical protein